jgi:hypothetical protein
VTVSTSAPVSVFAKYRDLTWPYRYAGTLHIDTIAGGIPSDEKVAEAWLRTKLENKDDLIREAVAETMAARGVGKEEAAQIVASMKHFTGFKRDSTGLYIEGRQLKAAIKEAAMIAVAAERIPLRGWGVTSKYLKAFVAEHIMVIEDTLHLKIDGVPVTEATGITQQFVHTQYGSAPHYKEFVAGTTIDFTVITDYFFTEEHWMHIWSTGEQEGIGASRSGGFGRYAVTRWDLLTSPPKKKPAAKDKDKELAAAK